MLEGLNRDFSTDRGTPGQGLKTGTVPAKPGRMVSLAIINLLTIHLYRFHLNLAKYKKNYI